MTSPNNDSTKAERKRQKRDKGKCIIQDEDGYIIRRDRK